MKNPEEQSKGKAAPPESQAEKSAAAKPETKSDLIPVQTDFAKIWYRDGGGGQIMRPVKADVTLFEKLGHFYSIFDGTETEEDENTGEKKKVYKYKHRLTSPGYVHLNKVSSISILAPQSVIVDGVKQPNPYVERNKRTRAIEAVAVRKMGIGYSPAGNIVVIDKTLFFNIYTYFIQSIQAKMKRLSWQHPDGDVTKKKQRLPQFPNMGIIGKSTDKAPSDRYAFYEIETPVGIWVNLDDPGFLECLEEHTSRQKFGDRIAQTIVERNILKDHPAIGISTILARDTSDKGAIASVTVYGYRNDLRPSQMSEIVEQAENGISVDNAKYDVKAETIHDVDEDEERAAREAVQEAEPVNAADAKNPPSEKNEGPGELFKKAESK